MWKWPSEEKSLGEVDSLHTLGRMDPRWFREEWGGWIPMGMRHWYRPPFSHIHGSIENGCIGKGNYYLVTSQFSLNYEYGRKGKVWTICQITWLFGAVFFWSFFGGEVPRGKIFEQLSLVGDRAILLYLSSEKPYLQKHAWGDWTVFSVSWLVIMM